MRSRQRAKWLNSGLIIPSVFGQLKVKLSLIMLQWGTDQLWSHLSSICPSQLNQRWRLELLEEQALVNLLSFKLYSDWQRSLREPSQLMDKILVRLVSTCLERGLLSFLNNHSYFKEPSERTSTPSVRSMILMSKKFLKRLIFWIT
jgi:hypothetical protein